MYTFDSWQRSKLQNIWCFVDGKKRNYGKIEQELELLRQEDVSNLIFQVLQRFTKHLIQYIFNVKKIELAPTM